LNIIFFQQSATFDLTTLLLFSFSERVSSRFFASSYCISCFKCLNVMRLIVEGSLFSDSIMEPSTTSCLQYIVDDHVEQTGLLSILVAIRSIVSSYQVNGFDSCGILRLLHSITISGNRFSRIVLKMSTSFSPFSLLRQIP